VLGWCRGSCGCTSSLGLGGSLVRVGGSCDGWMRLRRSGSVERCLRPPGFSKASIFILLCRADGSVAYDSVWVAILDASTYKNLALGIL
jgi:hypothetical protein